ncbi:hypothetical protein [Mycoplasmopsis pullorum]|uniref:Uncharacterized protein n=1 Tax=Mycoplasmopsis pullorum TaxID=48003 RepID=A0A1L4FSV9_9BACT|nr:hypothetical protein [Mycoplasmopsis pullorum]APJ38686.1 hypothetical protein BLA55_03430 [Mycoplasmopsis pullorum]
MRKISAMLKHLQNTYTKLRRTHVSIPQTIFEDATKHKNEINDYQKIQPINKFESKNERR